MGSYKQSTTQTQQSKTAPWQPTQGLLTNIIGELGGINDHSQATPAETSAIKSIENHALQTPNFGPQAIDLTNSLFAGGNQPTGMASDAYSTLQRQISPIANGSVDPTQTPGMQSVLDTIRNDVSNNVNSTFAGAGRDLSGLNQQALARGIAQGEAQPLLAQYNANVANKTGAANSLYGAGNSTAGLLSNLGQTSLGNQITGLTTAGQIPGMMNNRANSILSAFQTARGLPLSNMGQILNLLLPIAGLGSQSSASGTSNSSASPSLLQDVMGVGSLFAGGTNSAISGLFSDRRLKRDIQKVGALNDGTPIYRFRYLNDPTVHVGLMADEVEKYAPDAVVEISGYKAVDYHKATERAAQMENA